MSVALPIVVPSYRAGAEERDSENPLTELDAVIASCKETVKEIGRLEDGESPSRAKARWLIRIALLEHERKRLASGGVR